MDEPLALRARLKEGFTPGPWRLHDMEDDAIVAERPDLKGGYEVANVGNSCFPENRRHDARLIAAAPELLEMLIDLERAAQAHIDCTDGSELEYLRDEMFLARSLIAKFTSSSSE